MIPTAPPWPWQSQLDDRFKLKGPDRGDHRHPKGQCGQGVHRVVALQEAVRPGRVLVSRRDRGGGRLPAADGGE